MKLHIRTVSKSKLGIYVARDGPTNKATTVALRIMRDN